jgi:hypothetical protein
MSKTWKTIGALVVSSSGFVWNVPSVRAAQCPDTAPVVEEFHIDSPYPMVRRQLQRAIAGAGRRLSGCTCQTIFREFLDDSGRSLESRLNALHQSGAGYLYALRFVDSRDSSLCRADRHIAAFTERGSHVIRICGTRFESDLMHDPVTSEVVILHELLHSLGLGENPPTESEITHQIFARCATSMSPRRRGVWTAPLWTPVSAVTLTARQIGINGQSIEVEESAGLKRVTVTGTATTAHHDRSGFRRTQRSGQRRGRVHITGSQRPRVAGPAG